MSGSDPFSYAAPAPAATASSSRVIGETELRSLPLKKKQVKLTVFELYFIYATLYNDYRQLRTVRKGKLGQA